jgi:uncharacterized cupredoxin-like copper-binding protein
MTAFWSRAALLACLALAAFALAGCGGDGSGPARGTVVSVTERDFHLSAPRRLPAGRVNLSVTNRGPDAHELIVVRTGSRQLPLRSDGLTVDEDKTASEEVGALEPGEPGVRHISFRLTPGTYEVFCNMAGHYRGGMHRRFVVQ